jgi:hypothetical protein
MKNKTMLGITIITGFVIVVIVLLLGSQWYSPSQSIANESEQGPPVLTGSSNVAGQLSSAITLDGSYPTAVDKILVYKDVPRQFIKQDIISLGQKFGMTATDRIKEGSGDFGIMKEDHSMHVYLKKTGTIEFSNTNRFQNVNSLDIPGNLPSDEESIKIATDFLKERNLLPDGAYFRRVEHGKIYQLVKDGDDIITWEDVQIWYGRKLNGLEVKGTKISIDIGSGGDVIDFYSNWREYEPYTELSLITPEQAFGELKSKGISVDTNRQYVSISDISLAYRSKPGSQLESFLEPVWVFDGYVMENGKNVRPVEEYIPALTDDAVKSLSS